MKTEWCHDGVNRCQNGVILLKQSVSQETKNGLFDFQIMALNKEKPLFSRVSSFMEHRGFEPLCNIYIIVIYSHYHK